MKNLIGSFLVCALVASAGSAQARTRAQVNGKIHAGRFSAADVSLNWSGYVARQGDFTAVSGSWTVPKVRASKTLKTDAAWVGIGGVTSPDLIQAGTEETTENSSEYQAWIEMLPDFAQPIPLQIKGGDKVSVSIAQISQDNWRILLANNSTGRFFRKNVHYVSSRSSAEWIEEMPSDANGLMALDNFGSVAFSNGYAVRDGSKQDIKSAGAQPVRMANSQGKVLAEPSRLVGRGSAFEVKRLRA